MFQTTALSCQKRQILSFLTQASDQTDCFCKCMIYCNGIHFIFIHSHRAPIHIHSVESCLLKSPEANVPSPGNWALMFQWRHFLPFLFFLKLCKVKPVVAQLLESPVALQVMIEWNYLVQCTLFKLNNGMWRNTLVKCNPHWTRNYSQPPHLLKNKTRQLFPLHLSGSIWSTVTGHGDECVTVCDIKHRSENDY